MALQDIATQKSVNQLSAVPVIDLEPALKGGAEERKRVAQEIHDACKTLGFFYAANHAVPDALIAQHFEIAERFFGLPIDEKMSIDGTKSGAMRGYEPVAAQTLDVGTVPDLKEGYQMGMEVTEDHRWYKAGMGKTAINLWPERPEGFREHFETYSAEMIGLARQLMQLISLSLDLPEDYFDTPMETPMLETRILHYPPKPADAPKGQLGAGAHTDWGMLTLLLQDDVGGLEVAGPDGSWIPAPPIPGTFVVNMGDMVPIMTNDLYKSNSHRVQSNVSGRDRYSAPSFVDPDYETRIECVPTCMPESGEPFYPPTTIGDHVQAMFDKTYGKA
ncbi:MAG: 2-oxoglutarate and iron-dependent oxygenase domain-containing protein [Pseudomonadota bacterium]